jgi:hypothetical protein
MVEKKLCLYVLGLRLIFEHTTKVLWASLLFYESPLFDSSTLFCSPAGVIVFVGCSLSWFDVCVKISNSDNARWPIKEMAVCHNYLPYGGKYKREIYTSYCVIIVGTTTIFLMMD